MVFTLSLALSVGLICLNLVMLSSVHLFGANNWPPEISRVSNASKYFYFPQLCISIDPGRRLLRPLVLPERSLLSPLWPSVEHSLPALSQCKSIWDLPHPTPLMAKWAPGLARMNPGPWQVRVPLGDGKVLAVSLRKNGSGIYNVVLQVSTHFLSNHSRTHLPEHRLFYDFALLRFDNSSQNVQCAKQQFSGWFVYFIKKIFYKGFLSIA